MKKKEIESRNYIIAINPNNLLDILYLENTSSIELSKYNKNYNIYISINSFLNNRRDKKNLFEYFGMGFDLDNNIYSYDEIINKVKDLGLKVYKINKTYKGYHVYLNFLEELNFLDIKVYEKIWNYINVYLGGDAKMKSTTGILKVENFIDIKENRNFKIQNIYLNKNNFVSKADLEYFLDKYNLETKISFRDEKKILEKEDAKKIIKERNRKLINGICALEIISEINNEFSSGSNIFNKKITLIKQGEFNFAIDDTSGLKIFFDKCQNHWRFVDHTGPDGKQRYGIYGFFFNYYFKDLEKDIAIKNIFSFLRNKFGIILNKGIDNIPVSQQLILSFIKKEWSLESKNQFKEEFEDAIIKYNNQILESRGDSIIKLFIYLTNYLKIQDNIVPIKNEKDVFIDVKEFIKFMELSYCSKTLKDIRELFIFLSSLKINIKKSKNVNGKTLEFNFAQHFMDFGEHKGHKHYYSLEFFIPEFKKIIYLNKELTKIDKGINDARKTTLGLTINVILSQYTTAYLKKEDIIKIMKFSDNKINDKYALNKELKKISNLLKEKGIFKKYEILDTGIKYFKY